MIQIILLNFTNIFLFTILVSSVYNQSLHRFVLLIDTCVCLNISPSSYYIRNSGKIFGMSKYELKTNQNVKNQTSNTFAFSTDWSILR